MSPSGKDPTICFEGPEGGGGGGDLNPILNFFKFRKACLSKYGCCGSDKVGEHEALTSKYSQLNSGKGQQIWWLLSYN